MYPGGGGRRGAKYKADELSHRPLPRQGLHQFLKHLEETLQGLRISFTETLNDALVELLRARCNDKLCSAKQRMLVEDSSSTIIVIQRQARAHRFMKERSLLSFEGVKDLRVGAILLSATKITETFPTLKEPHGVILKEHPIYKEVNSDGIPISVSPDRNLKGYTLLHIEVRNELLEKRGTDRFGSGTKFDCVLRVRYRDIDRNLRGVALVAGMIVVTFVSSAAMRTGLNIVNEFIEIGAGGF